MSNPSKQSTREKLMLTAIDLFSLKGYKSVTTQEIALTAGVSEKTLFRHFGTKQNLLESAFDEYHYAAEMTRLFEEKLVWNLHSDLLLVSRTYHEIMHKNRKLFMISLKEMNHLPDLRTRTIRHPQQLLELLTRYLQTMYEQGKVIQINAELQAFSFMALNYGLFINHMEDNVHFPWLSLEDVITESVWTFTRALTP
ncbi:TetR/AcrR family transcriptional regulator [Paenibacillus silvae]|uniref:TetR/AcrR family transcriptional regulator n=1 Tax=Paenibacillus silvae TaxID=1325358 RepID=UPI0011A6166F|nr:MULTISPECIES: TetR/AcrR family transcriptional regulator [Paenibacillus]MCK6073478.1 TetR/AcrR family transcriptional regulator [Paenibacillus silvae]MCK6149046.1 TetR/AcrR family transcriptional regulator [Paenibacillus silvae]MCK6267345.1 TetR/AcrR family transcriptional regulator [Paenibacillus silvae]